MPAWACPILTTTGKEGLVTWRQGQGEMMWQDTLVCCCSALHVCPTQGEVAAFGSAAGGATGRGEGCLTFRRLLQSETSTSGRTRQRQQENRSRGIESVNCLETLVTLALSKNAGRRTCGESQTGRDDQKRKKNPLAVDLKCLDLWPCQGSALVLPQ